MKEKEIRIDQHWYDAGKSKVGYSFPRRLHLWGFKGKLPYKNNRGMKNNIDSISCLSPLACSNGILCPICDLKNLRMKYDKL